MDPPVHTEDKRGLVAGTVASTGRGHSRRRGILIPDFGTSQRLNQAGHNTPWLPGPMPDQGIPTDLAQAMKNLENALAQFQTALRESGVKTAIGGPVFQALRQWRTDQSRTKQVPPYVIATDATLHAIEETRPKTMEELVEVRGIGPAKATLYGGEILQIVASAP